MPDHAVSVKALRKIYGPASSRAAGPLRTAEPGNGAKEALKSIDLDIPAGSIFGLLGPNGAGKSTFINILAGLVVKTSGSVRIWGFDQDVNPRQSRAAIGIVPQELNLDPFFCPEDALEVQAGLYGVPPRERQTAEILRRVGLEDKARAYPRALSGGMRRRLLVAKALVHRPAVLVLDEPTAGVDIELRQMLWAYVRDLNANGMTVILTTHYLEEAEEMCDRIAIINQGSVVACEETASLIGRLDTKALVLRVERLPETLPELGSDVQVSRRGADGLCLSYSQSRVTAPDLIARVQAAGLAIADISTEEPDLEQVFLELTRRDRS
ncbi:MAG: ABC transporter ATP-binding protein [Pseudomonadota bacterium]